MQYHGPLVHAPCMGGLTRAFLSNLSFLFSFLFAERNVIVDTETFHML